MPAQVATSVRDLAGRGFPEHRCTLTVAAELLMTTPHALREWLRVHDFPRRYQRTGNGRTQRVLTASECQRISEMRTLAAMPRRYRAQDSVPA